MKLIKTSVFVATFSVCLDEVFQQPSDTIRYKITRVEQLPYQCMKFLMIKEI